MVWPGAQSGGRFPADKEVQMAGENKDEREVSLAELSHPDAFCGRP
jgi:hypothetical protein